MVLAALTAAAMTIVIMRLKRPVAADAAVEGSPGQAATTAV
jgi:cytochrome c oxidase assembly protein subunit 15